MVRRDEIQNEERKILIGRAAIAALDIKLKNKNYDEEQIIPEVLRNIKSKDKNNGVLIVASASKALKYYNKTKDYKSSIGLVLQESGELMSLLNS